MKKDFAIIGLGAFGQLLCKELTENGANVIALDIDEERVNAVADYVTVAYCCDCTKRSALEKLGLDKTDDVIIAMGEKLEPIILTVILLKELGVQNIIARAETEGVRRVLLHMGVKEVIDTRELAVSNLFHRLLSHRVTRYYEITETHGVAALRYEGKDPSAPLYELDLRGRYHLNVLLIRRGARDIVPSKDDRFEPGDTIVVFGREGEISKMDKKIKF